MPEIAIKQTLSDQSFRSRLDENGEYMRRWGQSAVKEFERVKQAAADAARWDPKSLKWEVPEGKGVRSAEYAWSAAMADAARTGGGPSSFGRRPSIRTAEDSVEGGLLQRIGHRAESLAHAAELPGLATAISAAMNPLGVGLLATTAAVTAFVHGVREAAEQSDRLADQAERMGMSLSAFETYSVLAKETSVDVGTLANVAGKLNKNIGEGMEEPTSKAAKALQQLGMSVDYISSLSAEDAFNAVGQAVGGVQNKFERARLEVALFGKAGQEVDLIVKKMAHGGMEEAAGLAVSSYDRARLASAGESIEKLSLGWTQFWTRFKANAAEAFGLVDSHKVEELLKPPAAASKNDIAAEQTKKLREEIENIGEAGKSARDKFIDKFHPSAEQMAAWDAVAEKVDKSKDATEKATRSIEQMESAVAKLRAELEGTELPNQALADFQAGRKFKDSDVERLKKEIADAQGALEFAKIDRDRNAGGTKHQTALNNIAAFEKEIGDKQRQLADAEKEKAQAGKLASLPTEQAYFEKQIAAQREADSAAKSWGDRLQAATGDADEIAAKLIAGSKEFAGNLNAARMFVQEVKVAEKAKKLEEDAGKFEEKINDAYQQALPGRQAMTDREIELQHLDRKSVV